MSNKCYVTCLCVCYRAIKYNVVDIFIQLSFMGTKMILRLSSACFFLKKNSYYWFKVIHFEWIFFLYACFQATQPQLVSNSGEHA